MRVLVISSNPEQASFRQRIGIYLDLLREHGMECEVVRLPRGMLQRRRVFASVRPFDGVLLHRKPLNLWDALLLRRNARAVVYDFDDAVMYNDRRPQGAAPRRFHCFARSVKAARLVLAGNEHLAAHARRYHNHVQVLPTGLDLKPYRETVARPHDGNIRLVWIGSRSTLKYLRELQPALEELGRRSDHVILRMICNEFFDLQHMKVEKCVWSSRTEAADLLTSDIGLAPLPDDRFTRGKCGFKILQYHAAGLPVVASPVGVNADYVRDGVTGFLAREPAQWVERLSALIRNPALRTAAGQAGARDAERFDKAIIGTRFAQLVAGCFERRAEPARRG
jgi:glycosyltransferase involved in cell wall biosynthesis